MGIPDGGGIAEHLCSPPGRTVPLSGPLGNDGGGRAEATLGPVSMPQDSRFEVSKNGTLRINSVEVYDGTWYRCVSSTPAGSIEAQARVQVLGEPVLLGRALGLAGRRGKAPQGPDLRACPSVPPASLH